MYRCIYIYIYKHKYIFIYIYIVTSVCISPSLSLYIYIFIYIYIYIRIYIYKNMCTCEHKCQTRAKLGGCPWYCRDHHLPHIDPRPAYWRQCRGDRPLVFCILFFFVGMMCWHDVLAYSVVCDSTCWRWRWYCWYVLVCVDTTHSACCHGSGNPLHVSLARTFDLCWHVSLACMHEARMTLFYTNTNNNNNNNNDNPSPYSLKMMPDCGLPDEVLMVLRCFLPMEHFQNLGRAMQYAEESWKEMVEDVAVLQGVIATPPKISTAHTPK